MTWVASRCVRLAVACVAAAVLAGGAALFVASGGDDEVAAAPVLLVPGYAQPTEVMSSLRRALERDGRRVIDVALPSRGTGDIDASARFLADVAAGTGAERVDVVGFSAGALVVRAYGARFDDGARLRRAVLLGAPNHGARIAEVAAATSPELCFGSCLQMRPGSAYLRRLNEATGPDEAAYTSVWTAGDSFVRPPSSAVLAGAVNVRLQDVCPGANVPHGALVGDALPVGIVLEALGGELASAPGREDCRSLSRRGAAALTRE